MILQKRNKINLILIYLVAIIVLFILGFFLQEDSSGGGRLDFAHEYKSFLVFKDGVFQALTSLSYESSRTPLFLILNSFNVFANDEFSFRLSNFIFNFIIFFSFFYCLKIQNKFELDKILLISSILLLSPYFRSSSYWAHQENLPFLFYFISLAFIAKWEKNLEVLFLLKVFVIAILSGLSFYSDQKFIFVSLSTFWILIYRSNFSKSRKLQVFLIYFLTSLPAFYLFTLWEGIVPKESQFRLGFYKENISASLSIISFYFIPLIIFFYKPLLANFKIKLLKKFDILVLFLIFLVILTTMPSFNSLWGNGVIYKLFSILNLKFGIDRSILFILFLLYLQLTLSAVYLILKNDIINFLPIFLVVCISSLVERTYNEYFDPLIFVLIFTFFKYGKRYKVNNSNLIMLYIIFYSSFLIFANIYYKNFNLNVI